MAPFYCKHVSTVRKNTGRPASRRTPGNLIGFPRANRSVRESGGSTEQYISGANALAVRPSVAQSPSPSQLIADQIAQWHDDLLASVDTTGLAELKSLNGSTVELTTAHPAGLVQLLSGRRTKLSSLFRDKETFAHAATKFAGVINQLDALAQTYGTATASLAVGVAGWIESIAEPATQPQNNSTESDFVALAAVVSSPSAERDATNWDLPTQRVKGHGKKTVQMPVLLHPVAIKRTSLGDFEVELVGQPTINPVLARELRRRGALLEPVALAASASLPSGFRPHEVLDRVTALGEAVIPHFGLLRRSLVGPFMHPTQDITTDFAELTEQLPRRILIRALAGDQSAAEMLKSVAVPHLATELTPTQERGFGDLDHQHQVILAAARTGSDWFVAAPLDAQPGKLSAAIAAEGAAAGRSVLYVSGLRRGVAAFSDNFKAADLDQMVLEVPPTVEWREGVKAQFMASLTPNTLVEPPNLAVSDALIGVRARLNAYTSALHRKHAPWGVSPFDALQKLAKLSSSATHSVAPVTKVRLNLSTLERLTKAQRKACAKDLALAAELGAFRPETMASPWYGATIGSRTEATVALGRVHRLLAQNLPTLITQSATISESCGLKSAHTVAELGDQLKMLSAMRETLDVFQPIVFERSVSDLVTATRPRKSRSASTTQFGWLTTRRLRKHAKGMVRPGIRVPNLSQLLARVEQQREVWTRYAARPGWPILPEGLTAIEDAYEAVLFDLKALTPVLATTASGSTLMDADLAVLQHRLSELAEHGTSLQNLPEREGALHRLRGVGLADLVADFTARGITAAQVDGELELAWWGSVFEQMAESDQALAAYDGRGLADLVARFTELDKLHVAGLAARLRQAHELQISGVLNSEGSEPQALASANPESLFGDLLGADIDSVRHLTHQFGKLPQALRPIYAATPALVPHLLPAEQCVDLVLLEGIEGSNLPQLIPTLARARQVIVIADPHAAVGDSVGALQKVLPTITARPVPSRRDRVITQLLAVHGYEETLRPAALPRGSAALSFEYVAGRGQLDESSGLVESTREELGAVVGMILNHARTRAYESLAVITLTSKHAAAIRTALANAISGEPGLAAYFGSNNTEPVVIAVADEVALLRRDAVIFSLGLGCTPHGRVVRNFGAVSTTTGVQLLNGILGAARKRVQVVSCLQASDFEKERLASGGPRYLYDLLKLAQSRTGKAWQLPETNSDTALVLNNPLLLDIATRLERLGCTVQFDYGFADGVRVPLAVGHPELDSEMLVAVLPDDPEYAREANVRNRDRRRVEELVAIGWIATQLFSVAAFLDPAGEANRIHRLVQVALANRLTSTSDTAPVPIVGKHERS